MAIYLSCGLIYYLLFCPTVTCFGAPYPVVGKVQLAGRIDPLAAAEKQHYTCNGCLFLQRRRALTRVLVFLFLFFLWALFLFLAMSTLGTSYYMESPILPEQDELAPRYSSTAGVEQPMLSSEYGGHDSCPLQAKSSIFAGSWSPISGHAGAANAAAPTYIHHPYAGGDSDGMFTRSWPLDPVSASLCLTGLPSTAMHYEIKPEPLIGSAECTTLETHTPLLSDNGSSASLVEIPCESATKAAKEREAEEEIKEVDASKWRRHFLLIGTNSVDEGIGEGWGGRDGETTWRKDVRNAKNHLATI